MDYSAQPILTKQSLQEKQATISKSAMRAAQFLNNRVAHSPDYLIWDLLEEASLSLFKYHKSTAISSIQNYSPTKISEHSYLH